MGIMWKMDNFFGLLVEIMLKIIRIPLFNPILFKEKIDEKHIKFSFQGRL